MPRQVSRTEIPELEMLGGDLGLDFANTVDRDRTGGTRHEYLYTYGSLVDWARLARIIEDHTHARLRDLASRDPVTAEQALRDALELRRAVQDVFSEIASGVDPAPADLDVLQNYFRRAVEMSRLRQRHGTFVWKQVEEPHYLDQILCPIAMSVVDLLRHGRLDRIKRCPGDDGHCGWLFLDTTKNRSRRWCSMQTCGSRDKMRRLYRRKK